MEHRTGNSSRTEIFKKPPTMPPKSTFNAAVSREPIERNLKRKTGTANGNEKRKASKRARKEVSLGSISEGSSKHNKKHMDEICRDGLRTILHISKESHSDLVQIQENSSKVNGSPLCLNDDIRYIPKRKRGLVGRSKYHKDQTLKPEEQSTGGLKLTDQVAKPNGDKLGSHGISSSVERKREQNDLKGKKIKELTVNQAFKEGSDCLGAGNANISATNSQRKYRRKNLPSRSTLQDAEPLVDNGSGLSRIEGLNLSQTLKERDGTGNCMTMRSDDFSVKKPQKKLKKKSLPPRSVEKKADPLVVDIQEGEDGEEDDEESLEETAAMMLSSRFDPSCTGFPLSNKPTVSCCNAELPLLLSSGQGITDQGLKSFAESESASPDTDFRGLQPRKQHEEKSLKRKRRHYYEISPLDLDGDWVLNRRIKVFWPSDKTWYDGCVADYDEETELHKVKYDGREEKWINLRTERFKLLLLRSEVPGNMEKRQSAARDRSSGRANGIQMPMKATDNEDMVSEDGGYRSSSPDSEPIMSWLARVTQRFDDSQPISLRREKIFRFYRKSRPPISEEPLHALGFTEQVLERDKNIIFSNPVSTKSISDNGKAMYPDSYFRSHSRHDQGTIVYSRRRFHKRGDAPEDSEHVTSLSFFDKLLALEEHNICDTRLQNTGPFLLVDDAGSRKLALTFMESRRFRFELSFLECSIPNYAYAAENIRLFQTVMLHKRGTMVKVWPQVHLEMLCLDNIDGLRFLSFEGCLKQAVALIFLVLAIFSEPASGGKYVNWQLPVTSISFKFSTQGIRKQLTYLLYNFSEVKRSKWIHLDSRLKNLRHSLLLKQLPLSECTFDNIKAFQSGTKPMLAAASSSGCQSSKPIQRRARLGISCMGVSRGYTGLSARCNSKSIGMHKKFPCFSLSFAAAPTFFRGLHLKLLMERNISQTRFLDCNSLGDQEDNVSSIVEDCSGRKDFCNEALQGTPGNDQEFLLENITHSECVSHSEPVAEVSAFSVCSNVDCLNHSQLHDACGPCTTGVSSDLQGLGESRTDAVPFSHRKNTNIMVLDSPVSEPRWSSDKDGCAIEPQISIDLSANANDGSIIPSTNPTGPRSMLHRNRSRGISGMRSHGWSDAKGVLQNISGQGPKKPRTHIAHLSPSGGVISGSRLTTPIRKELTHKRAKRSNEKKLSDVSNDSQKKLEMVYCEANLLLTKDNKGWREHGAQVFLEFLNHTEWKLAIKLDGITKYSYKADQFLHPGSVNRYTHAMMWKGGKEWILEFPDRSQWALFKEMHEECYNRNIHSASKNIPIPGVRLIEENGDCKQISFGRNFCKYFQQDETDIEMALNPSRILYDMDSDDEQWLKYQNSSASYSGGLRGISEELFEKTMDKFEKFSYVQQRDQFTPDEVEYLMFGVASIEAIKIMYEHWHLKRKMKGMPLIRHLQPTLWERYQQQLREWEQSTTKINNSLPHGSKEKPAMFAFCLKPRGLEVRNKGSKQRPHKKMLAAAQGNAPLGDQNGCHAGRKFQGRAFGNGYDGSLDKSPLYKISPRDMGYSMSRSKSKKSVVVVSPNHSKAASHSRNMLGKRKGFDWWNPGLTEESSHYYQFAGSQRYNFERLDGSDLEEFRWCDPSGAAKRAVKMAKIARERAYRLRHRADMAIQRAAEALMEAEAFDEVNG